MSPLQPLDLERRVVHANHQQLGLVERLAQPSHLEDRRQVREEDPARGERLLGVRDDLPGLGEIEPDAIEVDRVELEDARWFTRSEVRSEGIPLVPPSRSDRRLPISTASP